MKTNLSEHASQLSLILVGAVLMGASTTLFAQHGDSSSPPVTEAASAKIARALSAGPKGIIEHAAVIDTDAQGHVSVLREGTNDFTCMPGNPSGIGSPAMCMDSTAMQWQRDFDERKPKPTTTAPGIVYMLAGATQRSDSDPFDKTSPAIQIGPHWMIMCPFDPVTSGLPTTHRPTGSYIMWAGTPWAHVHVMGAPAGKE